ncbi:MAG: S8 family serine peptidase [Chitinophagales bacterium]
MKNLLLAFLAYCFSFNMLQAQETFVENQMIIQFEESTLFEEIDELQELVDATFIAYYPATYTLVWEVSEIILLEDGTLLANEKDFVNYINTKAITIVSEPNYKWVLTATPNDPDFSLLWGMHNTTQSGGTNDVDIDALEAWDIETGDNTILVGVIDTGIDLDHEDLAANIHPTLGYDFVNNDNYADDDNGHGTHVAGAIAAVGNNGIGVSGIAWNVQLVPLKIFDADDNSTTDAILGAINYAIDNNIKITNNSWGGGYSQLVYNVIENAQNAGHLFVAAAGNLAQNNDTNPWYPASYDLDNIISVAAIDHNDDLASFSFGGSHYGATSVDIAAPGKDIYSTTINNTYGYNSGTSMASPHVAGAVALLWSYCPELSFLEVKNMLLENVDIVSSLNGKCVSEGRLNVNNSLQAISNNNCLNFIPNCLTADSLELVNLYNVLGGDNWVDNSGWLTAPVSEWYGITLTSDGCGVKEIDLTSNNLTGQLMNLENLNLPNLQFLYLSTDIYNSNLPNQLSGNIPNFNYLPSLRHLYISNNQLQGNIPNFTNLANLQRLYLTGNQLIDAIPSFQNCILLNDLRLSNNLLTSLPNFYLPNLAILHLQENQLSGNIPDFSGLPNILDLYASDNLFNGNIPNFTYLDNVVNMNFSYNNLNGNIPDFNHLESIVSMNFSGNNLNGNIPDFSNLPNLQGLYLNDNGFVGNIPNFSNIPNLETLSLFNNNLVGNIPDFSNLSNLEILYLEDNELSNNIPDFSNLPNLTTLNLASNNFSGNLPIFTTIFNLEYLYLNSNNFTGIVPDYTHLTNLTFFHLYYNQLTFDGLENNITGLGLDCTGYLSCFRYSPQSNIPTYRSGNTLYVEAGGTLSNNTYTWYRYGTEIATITADSTYTPTEIGNYHCRVSNSTITNQNSSYQNLVLQSETMIIETLTNCNPPYENFLDDDITTCDFPVTLNANVPNMQFYVWNTGETTESITVSEAGTYALSVIDECGNAGVDEIVIEEGGSALVWPGDADNDGIVNHLDVLAVGLMHSETGTPRNNIDTNFEGYCVADWTANLPYGVNAKHADCDGNGTVEVIDVQAIADNYGQIHTTTNSAPPITGFDLDISQALDIAPTASNNYTFTLNISATNVNVYGLAYTINYTDACIHTNIDFSNSCLGIDGIDFVKVVKNDTANNKLYIGISRLNRTNANCGNIAKITMEVIDIPIDNNLFINLENGVASNANETLSEIPSNSINVFGGACEAPSNLENQNLTSNSVTLAWNDTGAEAYQLAGRKVGGTPKIFPETTTTFRTFTSGLQPSTCYEWTVKAKCDGVWTDWHMPLATFCTGAAKNGQAYSEANDPFSTSTSSLSNAILYPNPAKETVFLAIESGFETSIDITIFDVVGKKVAMQTSELQIGNNELKLDIDALETGIYFVEISNGFEKTVEKLHIF